MEGIQYQRTLKIAVADMIIIPGLQVFKQTGETVQTIENVGTQRLVNLIFWSLRPFPSIGLCRLKSPSEIKHSRQRVIA